VFGKKVLLATAEWHVHTRRIPLLGYGRLKVADSKDVIAEATAKKSAHLWGILMDAAGCRPCQKHQRSTWAQGSHRARAIGWCLQGILGPAARTGTICREEAGRNLRLNELSSLLRMHANNYLILMRTGM
jgi:hypothetical protein